MKIQLIMVAALLSGCATSATPELINGDYYMTGGPDCALRTLHPTQKRILCRDANAQVTGERTAMTPQQMQVYQMANQYQQQPSYVYQPMSVINYPTMQTPQVTPVAPGSSHVNCISTGIYTSCR